MVGACWYLMEPELLPVASIDLTMRIDSWSATSPKTTCLLSSQEVTTVVMKNWEPLLRGALECCEAEMMAGSLRVGSGVGHGQEEGLLVLLGEVLVGKLLAVDGLATGALLGVSCGSHHGTAHLEAWLYSRCRG